MDEPSPTASASSADDVAGLASAQASIVSRAQLIASGVTPQDVRTQVRARRWRVVGRAVVLHRGDRIAQLVIQAVERARFVEAERLPGSHRGDGGFGSSGGWKSAGTSAV